MTAAEACHAAANGIHALYPEAEVVSLPMSDGGEGMVACLRDALSLQTVSVCVHDPLMQGIEAEYAVSSDGQTAYMEMASAAGLTLVPEGKRNPMLTTTYGVGEMLADAVRRGCRRVVMGIGGSATCDGGRGMIEFLSSLPDLAPSPHRPYPVDVIVASDVTNPLYGPEGAAYVFAPQKGATPQQVLELDSQLRAFARQTEAQGFADPSLADAPGAGAAGGLGYGLMAYLDARLQSGIDLLLDAVHFEDWLRRADIVLTGEGKSDAQTLQGKVPLGVLHRAQQHQVPVHLFSGAIENPTQLLAAGFCSVHSINDHDSRPLSVLMQRDVAMQNLAHAVNLL